MTTLVKGATYHVSLPAMNHEYRRYTSAQFEGTYQGRRAISQIAKPDPGDDQLNYPDFASHIFYIDGDSNKKAEVEEPHLSAGYIKLLAAA